MNTQFRIYIAGQNPTQQHLRVLKVDIVIIIYYLIFNAVSFDYFKFINLRNNYGKRMEIVNERVRVCATQILCIYTK